MDFRAYEAAPGISVIVLPDAPVYTHVAASNDFLLYSGMKKEDVIGKGHFEVFPKSPGDPDFTGELNLKASFEYIIKCKVPHEISVQRYDVPQADGTFKERYWKINNAPILTESGEVQYIIHSALDITDKILANKKLESTKGIEKAYNFFMNAPVIIGFVKGDDYVIELANEGLLEVWGRSADVIGKPLVEAIPELEAQGFTTLLDQVRTTGEPFYAYEYPITLHRNGKDEVLYFDFVYKPFYENGNDVKAAGVVSVGHDVTAQVLAAKKIQESDAKYRTLFTVMDQGFCVLDMIFDEHNKPVDYRFLETNAVFEIQTGLQTAVGKTARELVPNLESHWFELYGRVALTGEAIRFTEASKALGRWFEVSAFPLAYDGSQKVALLFTDISERKKTEEALKLSESNLRNMILQAPVAMAILRGPTFIVEIANARMFELWGRGQEALLNKSIFEGLPEVRNQGYEDLLKTVYTTGNTFSAQGIPVTLPRDGKIETVYINLLYEAFRDGDGTISGVMAVATDVTEQVLARMKVEESNQQFRFVTDFMPQIIWATKPDGYHDFYNKRWYDYTGLTYEQSRDTGWNGVLHPDDQQRAWEVWRHSLHTGDPYEIEYRFKRHDGAYRWFLGRALPLRDEAGNILKWYGTCTDIDDQKKASDLLEEKVKERTRELANQKNLLDNILTNSSNGISVTEMIRNERGEIYDANTILANDAAVKYVGLPKEVYLTKTAVELDPNVLSSAYGQTCLKTLATGEPALIQYRLPATGRWLELTLSKMDDDHLIHIFTDVTPIKESQLELERTINELKRSNANLEEFAYAASHDLKEPIRKIRTFSDRLKHKLQGRLLEDDQHYLQRMEKATERMQLLIDDLLEYSHVSTTNNYSDEINLNKKVTQVLEDLEVVVTEKNARVIADPLPTIKGHRRQIQQLFQNLITNALKFNKPAVPPEIRITASVISGEEMHSFDLHQEAKSRMYHLIEIKDNGIGFEQEYAAKIFQMFQRLHSKHEYEGTGIGLAIVRKVVENHGGFISAESNPGEGATFRVYLPV